ncbi:hypothetical protein NDU88_009459 [Pleurodeles waltl]|uniref:Uncharacterized protein n=1 Tax=Pleurodeles waltl TaxID=8319 RepID=A0AAV7PSI8_PLEWA|nr:hypothetical protein NDU88_009459 [Pleurodeles waltl]
MVLDPASCYTLVLLGFPIEPLSKSMLPYVLRRSQKSKESHASSSTLEMTKATSEPQGKNDGSVQIPVDQTNAILDVINSNSDCLQNKIDVLAMKLGFMIADQRKLAEHVTKMEIPVLELLLLTAVHKQ